MVKWGIMIKMDKKNQLPNLLLGMGNPILSDDAVGVRLVRDFRARLAALDGLDIVEECSVGGLNLLDIIEGYSRVIVVDSIKTQGGVPGTWYYFTADRLRETMNLTNVHDTNFITALELGRRLGMILPEDKETHIFAVEIIDNLNFSEEMSEPLEKTYPTFMEEIFRQISYLVGYEG